MKSVYATDSYIVRDGHGGSVVSYHELQALTRVSEVSQIFQRVGTLFIDEYYPQNPFMYDYFIASLVKPEDIELAHFYGASFNLTSKLLSKARKFATVPAHNLELSLQEWNSLKWWQPPPPHLTDDFVFRYLCHQLSNVTVVCPSRSSADYLKTKLSLNPAIIPHGVDLPEIKNKVIPFSQFGPWEFKVAHISQFGPDKGQTYLFQAWKKFNKGTLTVVSNNMADDVIQGIHNMTIKRQISENEKDNLLSEASVYVQPSVTEGWGLGVGEAMAHATPVIVTEGVGAKDMVEDGKNGFIVPIRDPAAIIEKLNYLYDNPNEVTRMGGNARATAERYSWALIEQEYEKLWLST